MKVDKLEPTLHNGIGEVAIDMLREDGGGEPQHTDATTHEDLDERQEGLLDMDGNDEERPEEGAANELLTAVTIRINIIDAQDPDHDLAMAEAELTRSGHENHNDPDVGVTEASESGPEVNPADGLARVVSRSNSNLWVDTERPRSRVDRSRVDSPSQESKTDSDVEGSWDFGAMGEVTVGAAILAPAALSSGGVKVVRGWGEGDGNGEGDGEGDGERDDTPTSGSEDRPSHCLHDHLAIVRRVAIF